jgi:hypothetical protein
LYHSTRTIRKTKTFVGPNKFLRQLEEKPTEIKQFPSVRVS